MLELWETLDGCQFLCKEAELKFKNIWIPDHVTALSVHGPAYEMRAQTLQQNYKLLFATWCLRLDSYE
ncbi:hypothetical protein M404DRAFT_1008763 [Pisolithus tinctorius Marx 270]|uniref:Uncharacterized protein n=1 Tax=Pisolithus tinctorius Marx 270 TaxID=870435 RepID=A0A0C3J7X9_PISTI|nr:hypothetical protein M404DRAFT_1008763 [Pisolithus tinctorius Marx 270]